MRYEWPAIYLDGHTAVRHPATIRLMRLGLEVHDRGRMGAGMALC